MKKLFVLLISIFLFNSVAYGMQKALDTKKIIQNDYEKIIERKFDEVSKNPRLLKQAADILYKRGVLLESFFVEACVNSSMHVVVGKDFIQGHLLLGLLSKIQEVNKKKYIDVEISFSEADQSVQEFINVIEAYATYQQCKNLVTINPKHCFTYENLRKELNVRALSKDQRLKILFKELKFDLDDPEWRHSYMWSDIYKSLIKTYYEDLSKQYAYLKDGVLPKVVKQSIFVIDEFIGEKTNRDTISKIHKLLLKARCIKIKRLITDAYGEYTKNKTDKPRDIKERLKLKAEKNHLLRIKQVLDKKTLSLDELLKLVNKELKGISPAICQYLKNLIKTDQQWCVFTPSFMYFTSITARYFKGQPYCDDFYSDASSQIKKLCDNPSKLEKILSYICTEEKEQRTDLSEKKRQCLLNELLEEEAKSKKEKSKKKKNKKKSKKKQRVDNKAKEEKVTKKIEKFSLDADNTIIEQPKIDKTPPKEEVLLSEKNIPKKDLSSLLSQLDISRKEPKIIKDFILEETKKCACIIDFERQELSGYTNKIFIFKPKKQADINHLCYLDYKCEKINKFDDNNHSFSKVVDIEFGHCGDVNIIHDFDVAKEFAGHKTIIFKKNICLCKDFKYKLIIKIPGRLAAIVYPMDRATSKGPSGTFEYVVFKKKLSDKAGLCVHRFFRPDKEFEA